MSLMVPEQTEFDWLLGHARPWLRTDEVASAARCSADHVLNLITDGSLDFVIDIRTRDASRPCYRIFRPSFDRFLQQGKFHNSRKLPATQFDDAIKVYLSTLRNVLASWEVAEHLRCTDQHVLNLGADIALDLSSAGAVRCYPRTTREQLIAFMKRRKQ